MGNTFQGLPFKIHETLNMFSMHSAYLHLNEKI